MESWISLPDILTRAKGEDVRREELIHAALEKLHWTAALWHLPFLSQGVVFWNPQISVVAQGLFKCHQGNNKVTHMKQPLCGVLYGKHWIKLLHNESSAYERHWTVGEPNWKQCWIWFLSPLITYWHPQKSPCDPSPLCGMWEILIQYFWPKGIES